MAKFAARFNIQSVTQVTSTTWDVLARVIDPRGLFYAKDSHVGDLIYCESSQFEVTEVQSAAGANLACRIKSLNSGTPNTVQEAVIGDLSDVSFLSLTFNYASPGSGLLRYSAGPNCSVLGTATGITITKSGNAATIAVPTGVNIVSASVYFLSTEIGGGTSCSIILPSGFGINNALYMPQAVGFKDVPGSKTTVIGNYNVANTTFQFVGLTSNFGCAVNIIF